jgi:hypothetical protein
MRPNYAKSACTEAPIKANSAGEANRGVLGFDFVRKLTRLCGRRLASINETRTQYA